MLLSYHFKLFQFRIDYVLVTVAVSVQSIPCFSIVANEQETPLGFLLPSNNVFRQKLRHRSLLPKLQLSKDFSNYKRNLCEKRMLLFLPSSHPFIKYKQAFCGKNKSYGSFFVRPITKGGSTVELKVGKLQQCSVLPTLIKLFSFSQSCEQCGNVRLFLFFRFCMKSILENLEV